MSKIAVIKQSQSDWNYATIVIAEQSDFDADFDFDEFDEYVDIESTAHTFNGTDSPDFDEDVWNADIATAVATCGYNIVGDPTRVNDFIQTVPVTEKEPKIMSNIIKPDITGDVIEKMLQGGYIGYWLLETGEVYASTVDSGAYPLLDEEWSSAFGDIDLEQSPEVIAQLISEVIDTTWADTLIAVEDWQAKNEEV